jgi:subtilisin family serine protease
VSDWRRYVLPVICGSISEGLLLVLLYTAGGAAAPAALLLVLEAGILGFVFGARPGAVGAVAPIVVLGVIVVIFDTGNRGSDAGVIAFVTLLLGFTAAMVGSLRERYGRPRA